MESTHPESAVDPQAQLRERVAAVEREVAALPAQSGNEHYRTTADALRTSWAELVACLALSPAPALRACPSCHRVGMRAASRCGYCWLELAPLADGEAG